ncbi:nitroreductase family protein [Clostridium sp.]|uniref:nitroreductase family protein n=1 Tax=Clostridium sp. TaxID=1506 RepID=UPI0032180461
MDEILERKSIRKYTEKSISDEQMEEILRAAMASPSAGNQQPWDFIVVRSKETMNDIMKVSQHAAPLKSAPVAIVVCGDEAKEKYKGYWVQDCSAAVENILLKVTEMGLGAVWIGVYPEQDRVDGLKRIFNLPDTVIPLAVVPVGYAAEDKADVDRFNKDRIHYEIWNGKVEK